MVAVDRARSGCNVLPLGLALMASFCLTAPSTAKAQAQVPQSNDAALPDAPSVVLFPDSAAMTGGAVRPIFPPPCPSLVTPKAPASGGPDSHNNGVGQTEPCTTQSNLSIVINAEDRRPLTSGQKGLLAVRDVVDPFNVVVVLSEAGAGVGFNSHSAYGPGLKGFGRLAGYGLLQDGQGEFFGTYLIPSLTHEDPRYRRMQHASVPRRILHALERTVVAQHDDGRYMPNYATLLTYPISAELSNLYVPGVQGNVRATARRIGIGLATDPAGNLIAEFLPDLARRIHVRSIFIQQIVNQMASGMPLGQQ